jgi:hypothetical protein
VTSVSALPTLGTTSFVGYNNIAICSLTTTQVNVVGTVVINEGFINAFTDLQQEAANEYNGTLALGMTAGNNANNPNGVTGASAATATPTTAGSIVGTTLAVNFGNLLAGINYYVPTVVNVGTCTTVPSNTCFQLTLVSGPTSSAQLAGGTIGTSKSGGYPGGAVSGVYQLTVTNSAATAYYAVTSDIPNAVDSTGANTVQNPYSGTPSAPANALGVTGQLNLYETLPTGSTATGVSTGPTVSVYPVGNTAPGYPEFVTPTTPTVVKISNPTSPAGTTGSQGILSGCNTTLLFPYILTSSGYDTGLEITNAGLGSTVTGLNTITPTTAGSCTLTAYGSSAFGAAAITPFALTTSPLAITAGTVNAFTLSSALPAADPSFVGYLIASCNFQGAHGFGFVFGGANGATQGAGLSYGYLAPILADVSALNGNPATAVGVNDPF